MQPRLRWGSVSLFYWVFMVPQAESCLWATPLVLRVSFVVGLHHVQSAEQLCLEFVSFIASTLCCVKWHIYILKCNATLSFNVSTSVCLQETVINSLNSASRCFTAAVFYCVEFICCWRGTNHTDIYFDYCLLTDESVHLFDTNKAHYTHCTRFFWLFRSISLSVWQRHVSNSCSMFSLMWMSYTVASERLRLLCGLWAAPAVSSLTHNICKWIRMIIWRTCVLL